MADKLRLMLPARPTFGLLITRGRAGIQLSYGRKVFTDFPFC
jgi:hypothetical protein